MAEVAEAGSVEEATVAEADLDKPILVVDVMKVVEAAMVAETAVRPLPITVGEGATKFIIRHVSS